LVPEMDGRRPEDEQLDPTIAMPRVPPPPRSPAGSNAGEPAVGGPVLGPRRAVPTEPAAIDVPAVEVATPAVRPRFDFGNPVSYVFARFFAFVFDVALIALVATEFAYAFIAINPITGLPTNTERGFDATLGLGIAVALVYVWVAEGLFGTTLWKLAFGLQVFPMRGRFVGLGRALVRMLLRPIDLLVIGAILALLPGHRRLGDLLGGTIVARSRLHGFAPLLGWILILVLFGLPLVTVGWERSLATLIAIGEFVPHLIVRLWQGAVALFPAAR
jgi:uncharacterized RDD family membrane protein YckC